MWILAVCVALADIYAPYSAVKENPRIWTKGERVVYGSLRWTIWSFCIIWLIFACHYNYAGMLHGYINVCLLSNEQSIYFSNISIPNESVLLFEKYTCMHYKKDMKLFLALVFQNSLFLASSGK